MAIFTVHKGVDKPVEFRGLKSQYLFIFAGGLLGAFLLFVVFYMAGAGQGFCLVFTLVVASLWVLLTYRLNDRYGRYGLMKAAARRRHPRRIIHRKSIYRIIHQKDHANHS